LERRGNKIGVGKLTWFALVLLRAGQGNGQFVCHSTRVGGWSGINVLAGEQQSRHGQTNS
jgi:hypothetical protein